jgi:glucarate dehydratase
VRIVDLRVHSIAIADPPLRSSYGLHAPFALRTILELESDDGIVGISETHGGESNARLFENLRAIVVGADPYRLCGALRSLINGDSHLFARDGARKGDSPPGLTAGDRSQTHLVPGENPVDSGARGYSAIEIASLDLIGKSVGKAVCDLLGGRARDEVPFSAYLFYKHAGGGGASTTYADEYGECLTPGAMVRQARQMVQTYGFESIKLKAGVLDPEAEIETIRELRAAFGAGVPLRLDPNCAWTVETSVQIGRALAAELDAGGYLEDPAPGMEGMARVRRALVAAGVQTPLASNVAVTSFADLPECVRRDAAQIVLCDPHYWGGIGRIQHLSTLCRTFGLGLSMHSNSHLGVSLMAMAHAAAAAPHLTYACDTHYPWQSAQDEVVAGGRIPIVGGTVRIPDRPGLGIELDYDQLARGRERYARSGVRQRNDEAEMQKHVDANWKRVVPRW